MNGVLTNGTVAGVLTSGMITRTVLDGAKIVNKHTSASVSSLPLESSEWVKTNFDTRAVVNTLPSNFSPESRIPDGEAWQFQG